MSSTFYIHKFDGTYAEVTARTLVKWLAKPDEAFEMFRDLTYDTTLQVELTDGLAQVRRVSPQPRQQLLRLPSPDLPMQEYLADAQLQFLLPVRVRCLGQSPAHVRELIVDVVHGQCGIPNGFHFQIKPEDVSAMLGKMEACDVSAIADVEITAVAPYQLLSRRF